MAMNGDYRSKFTVLQRQWWRLHMSEKFSSGTINIKQSKKQTNLFVRSFSSCSRIFLTHVETSPLSEKNCNLLTYTYDH